MICKFIEPCYHMKRNKPFLATIAQKEWELKKQLTSGLEAIIAPLLIKPLHNSLSGKRNKSSYQSNIAYECDSNRVYFFFKELLRCDLYPLTTAIDSQSFSSLVTNLEKCSFGTPQEDLNMELENLKRKVTDVFPGLCLDCVLHGKSDDSKKLAYPIPHEGYLGLKED